MLVATLFHQHYQLSAQGVDCCLHLVFRLQLWQFLPLLPETLDPRAFLLPCRHLFLLEEHQFSDVLEVSSLLRLGLARRRRYFGLRRGLL